MDKRTIDPEGGSAATDAFRDWTVFERPDGFIGLIGPYYYQKDADGHFKVGFAVEPRHLNGGGSVHGGCLLSLADTSAFVFCIPHLNGAGAVTLQLDAKFISPGREGDIIIATGRVTHPGKSVMFVEGRLEAQTQDNANKLVMTFTALMKRKRLREGDG